MSVAASSYLTIQNKLVEICKLITTVGGVYNNTVLAKNVRKGFMDISKVTDFPAISVAHGPERKRFADEGGELHWSTATFGIMGLVKFTSDTGDSGAANDALDKFITDIQRVLTKNESMLYGGNTAAKSLQIVEVLPLFIEEENKGYVEVIVAIEYVHDSNL